MVDQLLFATVKCVMIPPAVECAECEQYHISAVKHAGGSTTRVTVRLWRKCLHMMPGRDCWTSSTQPYLITSLETLTGITTRVSRMMVVPACSSCLTTPRGENYWRISTVQFNLSFFDHLKKHEAASQGLHCSWWWQQGKQLCVWRFSVVFSSSLEDGWTLDLDKSPRI